MLWTEMVAFRLLWTLKTTHRVTAGVSGAGATRGGGVGTRRVDRAGDGEARGAGRQVKTQVLGNRRLGPEHGRGDSECQCGDTSAMAPDAISDFVLLNRSDSMLLVFSVMGKPTDGPQVPPLKSLADLTRWSAGPRSDP